MIQDKFENMSVLMLENKQNLKITRLTIMLY